jgi:hypothetical protein
MNAAATFSPGQHIFHRQLEWYGTYAYRDDLDRASSFDEFDNDEGRRITTAQLVAADEIEENG